MKSVIKTCFGLFLSLFLVVSFCFQSVEAQPVLMTTDVDIENDQGSMDTKSIDDLLGPIQISHLIQRIIEMDLIRLKDWQNKRR